MPLPRSPPTIQRRIANEGEEPREAVVGVDIVLDDIEGEVVGAAEGPDRDAEENRGGDIGRLEEEQGGGEETQDQKENAFDPNHFRALEIGHASFPGTPVLDFFSSSS